MVAYRQFAAVADQGPPAWGEREIAFVWTSKQTQTDTTHPRTPGLARTQPWTSEKSPPPAIISDDGAGADKLRFPTLFATWVDRAPSKRTTAPRTQAYCCRRVPSAWNFPTRTPGFQTGRLPNTAMLGGWVSRGQRVYEGASTSAEPETQGRDGWGSRNPSPLLFWCRPRVMPSTACFFRGSNRATTS